jgi:hypothetical protein
MNTQSTKGIYPKIVQRCASAFNIRPTRTSASAASSSATKSATKSATNSADKFLVQNLLEDVNRQKAANQQAQNTIAELRQQIAMLKLRNDYYRSPPPSTSMTPVKSHQPSRRRPKTK